MINASILFIGIGTFFSLVCILGLLKRIEKLERESK